MKLQIVNRLVQLAFAFCATMTLGEYLRKDISAYEKAIALVGTIAFLLLIVGIEVFVI